MQGPRSDQWSHRLNLTSGILFIMYEYWIQSQLSTVVYIQWLSGRLTQNWLHESTRSHHKFLTKN